jgi:hypothetical protein
MIVLAITAGGCASWKETKGEPDVLTKSASTPTLPVSKKSVVLEVQFVNLNDAEQSESLWQWIDETKVDAQIRQRLLGNGIRVGYVANEQQLRKQLGDPTANMDVVEKFLTEAAVASDVSQGTDRIPLRLGKRYELPLHQPIAGAHVALVRLDGETIGKTLSDAQYQYAITATSAANPKQLQLRLRPEIQHGAMRQKYVTSESALRIDMRRETWAIAELDLDVLVDEGDTLVIAPTDPVTGLGQHMLTGTAADQTLERVMVLLRIAQVPSPIDLL